MASKTFHLLNGATAETICNATADFLQHTKGMIAESGPTQGGWFVQAKEQSNAWKSISGMTRAIQVQILEAGENVVVNCDFGNWSDKVGAGAVGMFVFAPLAITAGIGAWQQKKLPDEVFMQIEKFIMYGRTSATMSSGKRLTGDEIVCPQCKVLNQKGDKFCKSCGAALGQLCPSCGKQIELDTKFCPECGESTAPKKILCAGCGIELPSGTKFCAECGTKM